jgi:hypothetical protein
VITVGLSTAVLCEIVGFLIAIVARALAGGTRLNEVLYVGANGPYLVIEWMSWLTVTICAVTALVTTRSVHGSRVTTVLLTCWVATTAASFLLVAPVLTTFCGTRAYGCAVALPHDLLATYGILAAQTPIYAAITSVLCLGLLRVLRPLTSRFGSRQPEAAAAAAVTEASVQLDLRPRSWWQRGISLTEALVLLAFVAEAGCSIYVFYNQLFAFS